MSRQNSLSFTGSVSETIHGDGGKYGGPLSMSEYGSKQKHKSNDPGREISFQVLEKFSLVTKFARKTTSSLFREKFAYGRQKQHVLDNMASKKYKDQQLTPDNASLPSKSVEWRAFLDPEGRIMDSKAPRKQVFYGGVDHVLRKEVLCLVLICDN